MTTSPSKSLIVASAIFAAGILSPSVSAQSIFTSGHGDVGVGYDESVDEFEPHWHLGAGAVVDGTALLLEAEYEPGDLVARTSATRTSPIGLSSAIDVVDGTTIYAAGSATYQPNIGLAAEELDPADWDGNITLTLTGWTIPSGAGFALYSTNLAGDAVADVIFSTVDASETFASNSLPMVPGEHLHFQWGFTDLGDYDLEFTWTGTHLVDGAIETVGTFSVEVVPEPSTVAMLGLGLALALMRRRRHA